MIWLTATLNWYFYLLLIGLIFFPFAKKLFSSFFDFGYSFAKPLAIIILSYLIFVLATIKILPFSQLSLLLLIIAFTILSLLLTKKRSVIDLTTPTFKKQLFILIFEEVLFLISLIFLTYVRGQEPSIRGLEKFMDFGFINSILRSKYFPPLDMWLSADTIKPHGYPINYYYFGHLTGAFLIKLSGVNPAVGYNLILATIFAQGTTCAFALSANLIYLAQKKISQSRFFIIKLIFFGLLGSFIVNLAGNLHTIYVFSSGYPNDKPIPFWAILSGFNPSKYWYPNATRFIPFTIHEFPTYSYVVADLHGHVFDIPFVLLTIALLFVFFINAKNVTKNSYKKLKNFISIILNSKFLILNSVFFGFLSAIHYMTNAFDGPIYILLISILFFLTYGWGPLFFINMAVLLISLIIFSLPFSLHFSPFISGIGVNCSPDFLTNIKKLGPFLFEQGNCQVSPLWMLFVLWGFFWINFLIFAILKKYGERNILPLQKKIDIFIMALFSLGTLLIIIPEFFYIKDIYPAHFRANTMFKLGYQAFIMMAIASGYVFYKIGSLENKLRYLFKIIFAFFFFFILIYPYFAFPSYYGKLDRQPQLDGSTWFTSTYPQDEEIVNYLNEVEGQPIILEAQGDSYTDYERISAYTGLPTVAGWWVHEWLWRGSPDTVGTRIPDINLIYESSDPNTTIALIKKYHITYLIVSSLEREKYKNLNEEKFNQIGKKVFETSNRNGAIYQFKYD